MKSQVIKRTVFAWACMVVATSTWLVNGQGTGKDGFVSINHPMPRERTAMDRVLLAGLLPFIREHEPAVHVYISDECLKDCHPLNIELHVMANQNLDVVYHEWFVASEPGELIPGDSFNEIYYRYEAPDCFDIQLYVSADAGRWQKHAYRHVCLK